MWALVSPDGAASSQMFNMSASLNLPLHHKVQKFSSGTGSPGSPGKRAVKWLCGVVLWSEMCCTWLTGNAGCKKSPIICHVGTLGIDPHSS